MREVEEASITDFLEGLKLSPLFFFVFFLLWERAPVCVGCGSIMCICVFVLPQFCSGAKLHTF